MLATTSTTAIERLTRRRDIPAPPKSECRDTPIGETTIRPVPWSGSCGRRDQRSEPTLMAMVPTRPLENCLESAVSGRCQREMRLACADLREAPKVWHGAMLLDVSMLWRPALRAHDLVRLQRQEVRSIGPPRMKRPRPLSADSPPGLDRHESWHALRRSGLDRRG